MHSFALSTAASAKALIPALVAVVLAAPTPAAAFCGFYVNGSGDDLFADATRVVLMRDGTRTVLSMQNQYEGPPEAFALVIPVPVVLDESAVQILDNAVFETIDELSAPRLVEYWEQDPCLWAGGNGIYGIGRGSGGFGLAGIGSGGGGFGGVRVEAEFEVGEYDIVILSAEDSLGLDRWLRDNDYAIPDGAEEVLRPYVADGMKFFVARVNIDRLEFEGDRAVLSPLRFHYDTETFSLPVRLGLLNANGAQDLIAYVLAPNQRYEVANYNTVFIPTNLEARWAAVHQFAALYNAVFDRTLELNPGAVVTEYAWDARTCDPCPGPRLTPSDLQSLGADVVPSGSQSFVLTRLHARYTADELGEDLVFRAAPPVSGGREVYDADGVLESGALPNASNNFQFRAIVRHRWRGEIACEHPERGIWVGPPDHVNRGDVGAATGLSFGARTRLDLARVLRENVADLAIESE